MLVNLVLGFGLLIVSAVLLIWFVKKLTSDVIN
jgi:hypothetical protein